MSDVTSIERGLREAHARLAALADALARADVEHLERSAGDLADAVTRLRHSAETGARPAGDVVALASADIRWQLERCRRLGRVAGRAPDVAVAGYAPDGRSSPAPSAPTSLEVLG